MLLNGIPLNEPSGPSRAFDFATLSLDNVERIEVLQGPQSPLYGSDAVGGVINIITRRGRSSPGAGLRLMGGSFGTHRESAYARGAGRFYDYSIGGSWLDTDGFSSAARGIWHDSLYLQIGAANAVPISLSGRGRSLGQAHIVEFSGRRARFRSVWAQKSVP